MVAVPEDGEGLGWIIEQDPAQLLMISGLQPASVAAAAAGSQQALAYLRFTVQHYAAYPEGCITNDLDRALLQAVQAVSNDCDFLPTPPLLKSNLQLFNVFSDRRRHTMQRFVRAVSEGNLGALMWLRAICPLTWTICDLDLMRTAAGAGQLGIMKYLRSGPDPEPWDEDTTAAAVPHWDCLEWLLSPDAPGGPCAYDGSIFSKVARDHGLPAVQRFCAYLNPEQELKDPGLLRSAVELGDQATAEWLRARSPPAAWDASACEQAAACGNISMLERLRSRNPPCPWDESVTAAAAWGSVTTMQWLRAQMPPCPWGPGTCVQAAMSGNLEVLIWLRAQDPPCPWDARCAEGAATQPNVELMQWLSDNQGLSEPSAMLPCAHAATVYGRLPMLEWLSCYGVPLTGSLYGPAAQYNHSHILRFLHGHKISIPEASLEPTRCYFAKMPLRMFLLDIGMQLNAMERLRVSQARRKCCLFHGLIRWFRRAVSDPSRKAHLAFDGMAADRSGQLLLLRLSQLPPELISKIAVAAELQHDIFDSSSPPG